VVGSIWLLFCRRISGWPAPRDPLPMPDLRAESPDARFDATRSGARAAAGDPAVSICIPTYNGAAWIGDAIRSALAQSFSDIEVVICDDASTDDTVARAGQFDDERIRLIANPDRVGMARNWNRCARESRGAFVKFLMQDDRLSPDCVERMIEVMKADPGVGLVFSSRNLEFDDPRSEASALFRDKFGELHARLAPLSTVNDGRTLFAVMKRDRFRDNMIGEPTAVMVSRSALARLGLFNANVRQLTDLEMWLRVAYYFDIGFVAEPLATFRVHARSASASNERSGSDWLDRVWLLEGLRMHPEIRSRLASRAGRRIWLLTFAHSGKRLITDGPRALPSHLRELGRYLRFRLRRQGVDTLHEPLAG
jgi:glycosyltransferase involved in cell wall biosynthesis